jgi:hypothetical protein
MEGWIMSTVLAFPQPNVKPRNSAALKAEDNIKKKYDVSLLEFIGLEGNSEETEKKIERGLQKRQMALATRF